MGAEKIYNGSLDLGGAVGDGEGNPESYRLSTLSVDLSLPLPAMTPRIMFVSIPLSNCVCRVFLLFFLLLVFL